MLYGCAGVPVGGGSSSSSGGVNLAGPWLGIPFGHLLANSTAGTGDTPTLDDKASCDNLVNSINIIFLTGVNFLNTTTSSSSSSTGPLTCITSTESTSSTLTTKWIGVGTGTEPSCSAAAAELNQQLYLGMDGYRLECRKSLGANWILLTNPTQPGWCLRVLHKLSIAGATTRAIATTTTATNSTILTTATKTTTTTTTITTATATTLTTIAKSRSHPSSTSTGTTSTSSHVTTSTATSTTNTVTTITTSPTSPSPPGARNVSTTITLPCPALHLLPKCPPMNVTDTPATASTGGGADGGGLNASTNAVAGASACADGKQINTMVIFILSSIICILVAALYSAHTPGTLCWTPKTQAPLATPTHRFDDPLANTLEDALQSSLRRAYTNLPGAKMVKVKIPDHRGMGVPAVTNNTAPEMVDPYSDA
jgi:hypothetical protein